MSIINALVDHGHSHESKLFADVISSHNEIVASLESHNRELLSVIAAKDEALNNIKNNAKEYGIVAYAEDVLAINPGDIALIEAMDRTDAEWSRYKSTGEGIKFYTIQTKSNTE